MAKATTKKAAKKAASPAPAAAAPAPEKSKPVPAKKTAAKTAALPAVTPAPATVTAKKAAPKKTAVKKVATKATIPAKKLTTVVAKFDVGFGNALYLRGAGAGLSWEKGVLMGCVSEDEWVWSTDSVDGDVEFKVLINDETWASGANAIAAAGERVVIEPTF